VSRLKHGRMWAAVVLSISHPVAERSSVAASMDVRVGVCVYLLASFCSDPVSDP
jgi:hypothetical protein